MARTRVAVRWRKGLRNQAGDGLWEAGPEAGARPHRQHMGAAAESTSAQRPRWSLDVQSLIGTLPAPGLSSFKER